MDFNCAAQDMGNTVGWIGIATVSNSNLGFNTPLHNIGYPMDKPGGGIFQWETKSWAATISSVHSTHFNTEINTFQGHSGGPFIKLAEPFTGCAIGLLQGDHYHNPWFWTNYADNAVVRINTDRFYQILRWIAERL